MLRSQLALLHGFFGFLFLGAIGCGSGGETGGDLSMGSPGVLAGTFQVTLVAPDAVTGSTGYTSLLGKVSNGPSPSGVLWTVASSMGDCTLLKPRVPFCNTPCGSSAVCVDDNVCQAYPKSMSVGTVQASGITTTTGEKEFALQQVSGAYQPASGVSLPFPAFAEGDSIQLKTSGGAYAPMTLRATGIAPLALTSGTLQIAPNQGARLSWTAAKDASASSIYVKLDISHHGGTKGMIECTSSDSGALDLPAGLITDLINLGTAGYPTIVVRRSARPGSAVIAPGRVDLVLSSTVEQAVSVPGVVSCTSSAECPMGKSCQSDLTCK
ncbi:MAG: hypothetical protein JNJ46_00525 [Myxococcales bacterium]|nr:hypothetical protein [Myxococcales bacterium]